MMSDQIFFFSWCDTLRTMVQRAIDASQCSSRPRLACVRMRELCAQRRCSCAVVACDVRACKGCLRVGESRMTTAHASAQAVGCACAHARAQHHGRWLLDRSGSESLRAQTKTSTANFGPLRSLIFGPPCAKAVTVGPRSARAGPAAARSARAVFDGPACRAGGLAHPTDRPFIQLSTAMSGGNLVAPCHHP